MAEVAHEHLSPLEVCQLNAHRKARAVAKKIPDALVLGADTLVFLDNEILGKPRNLADARRMLARLQGRHHQVVTGVCLMHLRTHRERIFAASTDVLFHPLNARQIRDYLADIHPLDKAGRLCHPGFRRKNHLGNLRLLQQCRRPAGGKTARGTCRLEPGDVMSWQHGRD